MWVLLENILEEGEERSIVKTFFVKEGVWKIGIALAIVALCLLLSKIS
jgi:hypothetical protein